METSAGLNKVFGEHLRRARREAHLTQEELAFRAQLDRTYISLLERGEKGPTLLTFFRLCQALNQQPDAFIAQIYAQFLLEEEGRSSQNE